MDKKNKRYISILGQESNVICYQQYFPLGLQQVARGLRFIISKRVTTVIVVFVHSLGISGQGQVVETAASYQCLCILLEHQKRAHKNTEDTHVS